MLDFLGQLKRTHYCGELRATDDGRDVVVMGWVHRRRDLGNLLFLDVRDRSGILQVVFNKETQPEAHAKAEQARAEFVVAVEGRIVKRQKPNLELATGEIELIVKALGTGGEWIASRREGDRLDLLGPLGSSFIVHRSTRNLLLVAGGTGIAPMRVLAEQEAGRRNVTLLMGGRSVAHLWPSDRLPPTVEYVTTTEDGSFGIRGRVTDAIGPLLEWADQVCACGPWPMLAALGRLRDEADRAPAMYPGRAAILEAQIAVEQHMGCAMGVCRACVIVTTDGNARVCREGPVFGLGDVRFAEGEPATVGVF